MANTTIQFLPHSAVIFPLDDKGYCVHKTCSILAHCAVIFILHDEGYWVHKPCSFLAHSAVIFPLDDKGFCVDKPRSIFFHSAVLLQKPFLFMMKAIALFFRALLPSKAPFLAPFTLVYPFYDFFLASFSFFLRISLSPFTLFFLHFAFPYNHGSTWLTIFPLCLFMLLVFRYSLSLCWCVFLSFCISLFVFVHFVFCEKNIDKVFNGFR